MIRHYIKRGNPLTWALDFIGETCLRAGFSLLKTMFILFSLLNMGVAYTQNYDERREQMVASQIKDRGIYSRSVLRAMRMVPRHEFVPTHLRKLAYEDRPLPIGHSQTISQPYIVAYMSEALKVEAGDKILEIGTGSGYQAAILAQMGLQVFTIEIIPELEAKARENLLRTGYQKVSVRCGDGYKGWPEEAPFDAIILTAAPEAIPPKLIEQLKPGGIMILPVGPVHRLQYLKRIVKKEEGYTQSTLLPVRFVPMVKPPRL
jgi:protein-L-isoaspartate(D-aspartate) O-methyltransferase